MRSASGTCSASPCRQTRIRRYRDPRFGLPSPPSPLPLPDPPPRLTPRYGTPLDVREGDAQEGGSVPVRSSLVALHGSSLRRYRKPSARVRPLRHTPVSRRIRGTQPTLTWAVDLPSFRER